MDGTTKPQWPISRLKVPAIDEVDAAVRPIVDQSIRDSGYVENWLISLALNPGTLSRSVKFFESLFGAASDHLSVAERELIATVVSAKNGCAYCEAHHTKGLALALNDPVRARRIALGYRHVPDLSPRERALADLAATITANPHDVSDAQINGLRQLGFSDAAILEAIEISAFFNFTNRVAISINNVPEDQLFDLGGSD